MLTQRRESKKQQKETKDTCTSVTKLLLSQQADAIAVSSLKANKNKNKHLDQSTTSI